MVYHQPQETIMSINLKFLCERDDGNDKNANYEIVTMLAMATSTTFIGNLTIHKLKNQK